MRRGDILTRCLTVTLVAALWWISDGRAGAAPHYSVTEVSFQTREDAYRANNIGVAFLEQFDYKTSVEYFRKALSLDARLEIAQINLAIALFNLQDLENATNTANTALAAAPDRPQPHYILGLIARNQNRAEDAISNFKRVLELDPSDVGANVNLGQIYMQQRQFAEASKLFRAAVESEPYHSTALYNLATALLRQGNREEGQALMSRFQSLRQSGSATSIGQNYFEQGKYAEALTSTGIESELIDTMDPRITFKESTFLNGKPATGTKRQVQNSGSNSLALVDLDGDGDLDLAAYSGRTAHLYRNDVGNFVDISTTSGDLARPITGLVRGLVAGDYDNDGKADLLAFGEGPVRLFQGDGKGSFKDVSAALSTQKVTPACSAAFLDADHDGDLDIFLGGCAPAGSRRAASTNILLRNNGNRTFTDISGKAKINVATRAVAVVPTDFDNRRDIDVLVLNAGAQPQLWQNMRDSSFRDVAGQVGLNISADWTSAAAGDLNKDGYVDFFFGRKGKVGTFAVSDGHGRFKLSDAPKGLENASSAQFIDYDNDGLLDLVVQNANGFGIFRNLGNRWVDETTIAAVNRPATAFNSAPFVSGDIDGDGDIDLIAATRGGLRLLKNVGGEANNSEIVDLTGRVSNKAGVGAKIDIRAGSLSQKLESYAASPMPAPSSIHFGLGKRDRPDAVRIIWPSGVIQAETNLAELVAGNRSPRLLRIEELDRKPSSCPYLYTWNGERFEFITDFMGGGEMGDWQGEGVYDHPDPDEFVRIPNDALRPKDGRYEIRVTNELEEVLFVDQLKLVAVEHEADTEVYPNEGLGIPTAGERILYTTRGEHPPLAAIDVEGRNVLPELEKLDRQFYGSFKHTSIRGYAESHALTLKLDDRDGYNGRTLLLLTGWTDYAFSSDNVAASQSGKTLSFPKLQVKNARGQWQTVIDSIGIAVGRPQTVVVDLTGKFLTRSRDVRIVTNVKTYWDKVAVDTLKQSDFRTVDMPLRRAELRERGFSRETKFSEMIVPDYEQVVNDGRWKYFSGRFTRTGDVLPLLSDIDDVFVISKTGDEIALSFDALPEPPAGKKYTFLLYADGYSKEMDINSASPDAVQPMPFRAMSRYPYWPDEQFPMTDEKRRIYDEYTTRVVKGTFPRIDAALLGR